MLQRFNLSVFSHRVTNYIYKLNSTLAKENDSLKIPDLVNYEDVNDDFSNIPKDSKSVLDTCDEDLSTVAPYLRPSFNFAPYVNKSQTLQELLKLGVDLYKLEKRATVPQFILGLDFERDIKQHVLFFHDNGVSQSDIGIVITRNPYIFKPRLEDLQVRINYLLSKSFTKEMISRILSRNPHWLMIPTPKIDTRLGFFQKEFSLSGPEIRLLATAQPKLITMSLNRLKLNKFAIIEEMGFSRDEAKLILLGKPFVYMKDQKKVLDTFVYLHRTVNIPTEVIAKIPGILTSRLNRLKQRHSFLKHIKRDQFNAKEPNYVSVLDMVSGTDSAFCENFAKVPVQVYNNYLKSM